MCNVGDDDDDDDEDDDDDDDDTNFVPEFNDEDLRCISYRKSGDCVIGIVLPPPVPIRERSALCSPPLKALLS
jgi:hypothetical protein